MKRETLLRAVLVGAAVVLPLLFLAFRAEERGRRLCASHGEALVEVREDGTLCSQDGGARVLR